MEQSSLEKVDTLLDVDPKEELQEFLNAFSGEKEPSISTQHRGFVLSAGDDKNQFMSSVKVKEERREGIVQELDMVKLEEDLNNEREGRGQKTDSRSREREMVRCSTEGLHRCDFCGRRFQFEQLQEVHSGERPFHCDFCEKSFKWKSDLISHTRLHTGEKPFHCDFCEKSFKWKSDLKNHTRLHTGERPFRCDFCEMSFKWKSNLKNHTRVHFTRERPFQCNICGKSFERLGNLRNHKQVHSEERLFNCDVCAKSFKCKSNLNSHKQVHSEERRNCDVCAKSFKWKSSLQIHTKSHMSDFKHTAMDSCVTTGEASGITGRTEQDETRAQEELPETQ